MNYTLVNNQTELPHGLTVESLAIFLNDIMRPYEDTVPDIQRGLNYALTQAPGSGGFVILAFLDEKVAGAVVILQTGMSGYVPANLLLFIGVSPKLRGHGIGSKLISMAKENCDGDIKLHVEPDNPARKLYERHGFANKYLEMRFSNS